MYNTIQDFAAVSPESPQTKLAKSIKNENYCRILKRDLSTQKLVQWQQELPAIHMKYRHCSFRKDQITIQLPKHCFVFPALKIISIEVLWKLLTELRVFMGIFVCTNYRSFTVNFKSSFKFYQLIKSESFPQHVQKMENHLDLTDYSWIHPLRKF